MPGSLEYWKGKELDEQERKLIQNVEDHDCHVLLVSGGHSADWAYSVGLYERFEHPEIVIFGLPNEVSHWIINELTSRIRGGATFTPDESIEGLLEGDYIVVTRDVEACWYDALFGWAIWFYRGRSFPVIQLIWPDKEGKYPWQPEFNPAWTSQQPFLNLADADEARMRPFLEPPSGKCTCDQVVENWTFPDDPHTRAITQKHIASKEAPILLVAHDTGKGGWQFLDGSADPQDLATGCLHHFVELDPSIRELADLPVGWQAWRSAPDQPWKRAEFPDDD